MHTPVTIRLLGPIELYVGNTPARLQYRRVDALLAYLAIEATASKSKVMHLLWPELPREKAQRNLRHVVYSLRKLGVVIHTTRDTIRLSASEILLDLDLVGEATDVWRGEFCEGLVLDDSPDFEMWLLEQRESLRKKHFDGLVRLAKRYLLQGEWQLATQTAKFAVDLEPFELGARRILVQSLLNSGRQAKAQKQIREYREAFGGEFGELPPRKTCDWPYKPSLSKGKRSCSSGWTRSSRKILNAYCCRH